MSKISQVVIKSLICILTIGILPHVFCSESFAQSKKIKKIKVGDRNDLLSATTFSKNGTLFATGDGYRAVKVFDTKSWELKLELKHNASVMGVSFIPNTKILAVGTDSLDEVVIWFWNTETTKLLGKYISPYKYSDRDVPKIISSSAISPNGKLMVIGYADGLVRMLNIEDLSNIKVINKEFMKSDSGISSTDYSADGKLLVIGMGGKGAKGFDGGNFKVFDVETGKQVFERHKLFVIDNCFFSPDNKTLYVEGGKRGKNRKRENVLRLFNTETWEMTEEIEGYWITGIDMSRNGKIFAIAEEKKLYILDANSKRRIQKIGNRRYIYSIAISPDGKTVVTGDDNGNIRIFPIKKR